VTADHGVIRLAGALGIALTGACGGSSAEKASDTAADSSAVQAPAATPDSAVAVARVDTPRSTVPNASPPAPPASSPPSSSAAQPTSTPTPTPSEDVMIGRITTGGLAAEPVTSLQVEGRGAVTLVGPLEPELRRLNGATVSVAGAPAAGGRAGSFTASRYDIVAIDGVRPAVGTIVARGTETLLAATDTLRLTAAPAELRSKTGAKVWIVGRRSGAELTVQTYGVIRER